MFREKDLTFNIDRFSNIKNPYDVLGVLPTSNQEEIKKSYRTKARITHPDRHPSKEKDTWEKRFQDIQESYEILSNPLLRKDYDEYLKSQKISGKVQLDNFWNKVRSNPNEIRSEIARKKWFDELKTQNTHLKNFTKELNHGTKRRIWIYAFAGIVITIGFSIVLPVTNGSSLFLFSGQSTQTFDWQNMLDDPKSGYCDPLNGEQTRYCFYQNSFYAFDSDDGVHWYKRINSQVISVDLSSIPTSQTSGNSQAYSNAMGYHFCSNKQGNYLIYENCLQLETTLTNR